VHDNLVDIGGARSPEEIEKLLRLAVSRRKPYYTPIREIKRLEKMKE